MDRQGLRLRHTHLRNQETELYSKHRSPPIPQEALQPNTKHALLAKSLGTSVNDGRANLNSKATCRSQWKVCELRAQAVVHRKLAFRMSFCKILVQHIGTALYTKSGSDTYYILSVRSEGTMTSSLTRKHLHME